MIDNQQTIGARVEFSGVGVHSGSPVCLTLLPADPDTGIVFHSFAADGTVHEIPAVSTNVVPADLATMLGDPAGAHVATVEHLMAALYAVGVDNVIVQIDANETPIMDGCAAAYIEAIEQVGLTMQRDKRNFIRVRKPVHLEMNGCRAEFMPYAGSRFEVEIDFPSPAIGRQSYCADISAAVFKRDLSRARTFGFMKDVERLWASGHALGSSLENSVVIGDDDRIVNPDGLRYVDEFVRHKALDAIGDIALAGMRILGCYRSYRGGHKLNALALKALLADPSAYEIVQSPSRRREVGRHAQLAAVAAPAFGPQTV